MTAEKIGNLIGQLIQDLSMGILVYLGTKNYWLALAAAYALNQIATDSKGI